MTVVPGADVSISFHVKQQSVLLMFLHAVKQMHKIQLPVLFARRMPSPRCWVMPLHISSWQLYSTQVSKVNECQLNPDSWWNNAETVWCQPQITLVTLTRSCPEHSPTLWWKDSSLQSAGGKSLSVTFSPHMCTLCIISVQCSWSFPLEWLTRLIHSYHT